MASEGTTYLPATPLRTLLFCLFAAASLVASPAFGQTNGQNGQQKQGDVRVTKAPKLIQAVKAKYTDDAVRNRIEGPVKLKLTISETGHVDKVEVLEGLGHGLDQAAVNAAKQFVFSPAEINNQPAAVVLTFTINFSLPILPAKLEGQVVDRDTGRGVAATVHLAYTGDKIKPKPEATIQTEVDGSFSFEQVPPGPYAITLKLRGYQDFHSKIDLPAGKTSQVTYRVAASPKNLTGRVRESGTRKPLAAVKVLLWKVGAKETFGTVYTDSDGRFSFRGVPPGHYALRFTADGYFPSTSELDVAKGQVTNAKFFIEAKYYDEYSVTTVAKRARTEVTRRRLSLEEMQRVPGTGGDVVRAVQNLPGVARAPGLAGLLIVRGSAPQDTRVYLDGDEVPAPYHFLGGPAVINSEMIDSLDFYPGNFSTYYGRGIGGVVDLSTRSPNNQRIHAIADVDLLDTTLFAEGPITKNLSIALSARRSYFDVFLPLILPKNGPDVHVAPRYYDYQAWLTWRGIEHNLLEVMVYGSDDRLELLLPKDQPAGNQDVYVDQINFENAFYRGQFSWKWRPNLPIQNDFIASWGMNKIAANAAADLFFTLKLYISSLRDDMHLKFNDHFTLRMGVDNQYGNVHAAFEAPTLAGSDTQDPTGAGAPNVGADASRFTASRHTPFLEPAVYIEPEIRPTEKTLLVPGLRIDHFGPLHATTVSPRFTGRWNFANRVTAKGGVGLFTQPPTPGSEDPDFGNPNIKPEKAIQYSAGTEWRPLDYFEADATGFYRDMYDLVENTDRVVTRPDGSVRPLVFDNTGKGRAFGLEVLLRHYPQNRFFGWVAYTLSWSQRLDHKTGKYVPYQYDQRHILTLVGGYNLPHNWDISTRFRLVSGNPTTPVVGSSYNADTDEYDRIYGPTNSARDPLFHQLDVRVDKKFVFDTWLLGFYLSVQNVYNHRNAEGLRYNYDYTDSARVLGLPIIPSIGIKGEFWADGPLIGSKRNR